MDINVTSSFRCCSNTAFQTHIVVLDLVDRLIRKYLGFTENIAKITHTRRQPATTKKLTRSAELSCEKHNEFISKNIVLFPS